MVNDSASCSIASSLKVMVGASGAAPILTEDIKPPSAWIIKFACLKVFMFGCQGLYKPFSGLIT